MATIITKNSSTASSVPAAGSLQQGELAVNVTDKKLYTKDSSAAVVKLVGSLGNQEASAVAITGGTINGTAIGGTSTSTGAFTTVSASGGFTGNLTGNASTVTNGVYTTGSYADPTWITSLAGSKITGNISGNATNVTGTVAIANGGTGLTALGTGVQTALGQTVTGSGGIVLANSPALVTPNLGTPSAATLTNATGLPVSTGISGLGTNVATALGVSVGSVGSVVVNGGVLGTPSSGTLTNATGLPLSTGVTGTLAVANGGTGQTTANAAFNALAPSQTSNAGRYLKTDGTNTSWDLLDISTADITGTLPVANGGTGLTSFTANGLVYASSTSALTTGSALTFNGTNLGVGGNALDSNQISANSVSNYRGLGLYTSTASARPTISLVNLNTANKGSYIQDSSTGELIFGQMNFDLGGHVEGMRLTSTGLGIGTSSPGTKLDVNGDARIGGTSVSQSLLTIGGGSTSAAMNLRGSTGSAYAWQISSNAFVGSALEFTRSTAVGGTTFSTPSMLLDSSGNLGIGTSSPTGIFNIKTSNGQFLVQNGTSANQMRISAFNNAGNANAALIFEGYSSEYGRFDSSGNLGLGVTPSAWSLLKAVQIGNASFAGYSGTGYLMTNAYFDGSVYKYTSSNYANLYTQNNSVGQHAWYIAASGTAGNTISFTQAMTLDASGNLLVGKTSGSGARLEVSGSASGAYISNLVENTNAGGYTSTNYSVGTAGASGTASINYAPGIFFAIGPTSNDTTTPIVFRNNNATERARITSGGNLLVNGGGSALGIGDQYVSILGTGGSSALLATSASGNNASAALFLAASTTSYTANIVDIRTGMASGTGFNAITYKSDTSTTRFVVAGNGDVTNTNGSYGTISDAKMKTDIVDAGSQWADIKAIRFRKFKMKNDPTGLLQLGVVAQELEQTSPGLVEEHADRDGEGNDLGTTTKSVKTSVLLMKAAVALQEAMARIEQLEAKVAALETK